MVLCVFSVLSTKFISEKKVKIKKQLIVVEVEVVVKQHTRSKKLAVAIKK